MKIPKRIISAVMAVSMIVSSAGMNVRAYNENENLSCSTVMDDETDRGLDDDKEEEHQESGIREEESGLTSKERERESAIEKGVMNFVMQESESIRTPGEQNVVASLGADGEVIEKAVLQYRNLTTGQEFTADAVGISEDMVRFSMKYDSESQTGVYQLEAIRYQTDGNTYQVVLADLEMEVVYGVNTETETEPDDILVDQEMLEAVDANVVTMDESGNAISENSIEDVLNSAQEGMPSAFSAYKNDRGAKNLVVVLDPGHDSTHAGAVYNGCREHDLVLSIALYCREELQKYGGVTVYMTRETRDCPNGAGGVSSTDCNAKRVEFAAKKRADVYVSFHLNASTSASARGVGVYYPNSNYRSDIGKEGGELATAVYKKLSALGLPLWAGGKLIHNSEDNTTYPDGSLADYLGVIRRSKLAGFPAILIEHAFVSNIDDVNGFLNSEAKLKKLGVADASAIAEYYKLSMNGENDGPRIEWIQSRSSNTLRIQWNTVGDGVSYELYRSTEQDGTYSLAASVTGNTYDDVGLEEGVTYFYKVLAVYSNGKKSDFSPVYSGKTVLQPKIKSGVSQTGGKIKITWSAVEGAEKYELYRSEKPVGGYKKIKTSKKDTVYTDSKVETQKTYYYKVRARGGEKSGYSTFSDVFSAWAVKSTKISSVSSYTSKSLKVKWKKIAGAYAYRIQRSTSKNGKYKKIATVKSSNEYIDENVEKGKTYYYKVQTLNRVNKKNGVSDYSKAAGGSTIDGTSIVYVKSNKSGSMEIKWKKDSKAHGYRIKRSTKKNGTYQIIAEIEGSSKVKYVDKTVTAGKRYYYVVESMIRKKNVKNYGGNAKPVSAINLKKVSVQSMLVQGTGVQISWGKVSGANGYQIARSTEKNGKYTRIADIESGSITSYLDTEVELGKRYYYKIRAVRTGKYIGYGTYMTAMEKWVIAAPTNPYITINEQGQISLSWSPAAGAAGYDVLRSTQENGAYEVIASLSDAGVLTYTDTTAQPGITYYYKIASTGKSGTVTGRGEETMPVSKQISTSDDASGGKEVKQ